ncbi:MAG: SagB/ThcOx family dehydrogenase [Planctomycetota bacterium]
MDWRKLFSRGSDARSDDRRDPADAPIEAPGERELAVVRAYHERTKHAPGRYANGPGWMDWDTQPDPFRRFAGAELLPLDLPAPSDEPRYEQVFPPGRIEARPLDRASLSQLLRDSLAISAWKRAGEAHWSLRVNPSSGNLHPTEGYVVAPAVPGLSETPFVAHYAPKEHALEVRARFDAELWQELVRELPDGALLVALTSIHWRESWKYGERAYRYCNHDVGHAVACVALAAAAMGWGARLLDGLASDEIAELLHLSDTQHPEAEEPDCVIALYPRGATCEATRLDAAAILRFAGLEWKGTPNELSPDHADWPVIDDVAACARSQGAPLARTDAVPPWPPLEVGDEPIPFRRIVHQRRSAVAMDARSGLARDAFFQAMRRVLPGHGEQPLAALPWSPRVHLLLFVHRVADLDPGLYVLVRDPEHEAELRAALDPSFDWTRPEGCPSWLPLFHLKMGDARGLASHASCDQAIAGEGCFSLGMLARFDASLATDGPHAYPRLFWETGAIGQSLYLEAEALGLRATGIGCFYDDVVHRAFGLRGSAWQSLYHFTVGGAVDDARITTEAAYGDRADH